MTLEEAMDTLQREFVCTDGPIGPCGPTGEPYVAISLSAKDESDALDGMVAAIRKLSAGRPNKIWWRIRPEVDQDENGATYAYVRLAIPEQVHVN